MTLKKWHTPIKMKFYQKKLLHSYNFLSLGSCFADNLDYFFSNSKINALVNPTGISFNPASIAKHIQMAISDIGPSQASLGNRNGLYFHDDFHSKFNNINPAICIDQINDSLLSLKQYLLKANVVIFSFGTAIVQVKQSNQSIVANCHKQDSALFKRSFMSLDDVVNVMKTTLDLIKNIKPDVQILLTVSPIRHAKEGFVENNQSKATLLLACKELCTRFSFVHYFPAYEIMMDELRDYRFYDEDMLHPSPVAIKYIMDTFIEQFFDQKSQASIVQIQKLQKSLQHKPLHPNSQSSIQFNQRLLNDLSLMQDQIPYLDLTKEIKMVSERLKI